MKSVRLAAASALIVLAGACTRNPPPRPPAPAPAPPPARSAAAPSAADRYATLPDTTVCVVDRTSDRGLRDLAAKKSEGKVVLLVDNQIKPLEEVHPVNVLAGYAGAETWFTRGQPITFMRRQYMKYGGERRVPSTMVKRVGDNQGVPLFAAPTDPATPPAVYVPVRPGCIFQAYVRDDLYRGR